MRQRGAAFLVSRQLPDGRFPSPPDQTGPRPMAWNVPVLSEIFALMALS
jgi:squalene-hopene/tetraprenyl-beta-curcumene cyclase/sporulenol synthase